MQRYVWELYCSLFICLNLLRVTDSECFAYEKTVLNQCWVEKSILSISQRKIQCEYEMNDFVGNILQNKFPVCWCILLSDTRPKCHQRSQPKIGVWGGDFRWTKCFIWTNSSILFEIPPLKAQNVHMICNFGRGHGCLGHPRSAPMLKADMYTYLRRCYATLGATGAGISLLLTAYCIEWYSHYPRCRWTLLS